MKKIILVLVVALFALNCSAKVWTVSDVASRPAHFSDIQTAHDSAWTGDTILVTGGGGWYWNPGNNAINIKKPLVIIGEGFGTNQTEIYGINLTRVNSSLGADSCKFYGIRVYYMTIDPNFSGTTPPQSTLTNILFERCSINYYSTIYSRDGISKLTFRNCLFSFGGANISFNNTIYSQVLFTNCVFDNGYIEGNGNNFNGGIIFRNNIFINRTTFCFNNAGGIIVENNIFYAGEPTGLGNSTFNNNITYMCNNGTIPYGTNVGSGNLVNVFPKFTNYPLMGGAFAWTYDFSLQAGSPAIGTGTNGTNIGLTGGNGPVSNIPQYPKIPIVTMVNIPVSSVPVGGNLQIQIKANTRQ